MRIGVVTTSYPRWPGDPAGDFVAGHVAWLRAAGHDVEVLAAGAAECIAERGVVRIASGGGLFYAGGAPEMLAESPRRWRNALAYGARLAVAVARRASSWDAIICHWLVPAGVIGAVVAGLRRGRGRCLPVLAIAHSGDVHLLVRSRLVSPAAALLTAGGVDTVFVSEQLRQRFVAALGPGSRARFRAARICSMGIDVAHFDRARARWRDWQRDRTSKKVVFLGRLVPVKGAAVAIAAAAHWRSDARLIVAGTGPAADELRGLAARLAPARVEFVGEVQLRERDRLLADADLLVLPSIRVEGERSEGLPVTALEALAARVPVVASRVGGLSELPAAAIHLVEAGDSGALAAAVDLLIGDVGRCQDQVAAGFEWVRSRDWARVGPQLLPR